MESVTAVVVDYHTGDETRRVVDELRDVGVDIVVVDNASDDELQQWCERWTGVEYVRTKENLGYTGGNNVGIERARERSEYVLVVNPDVHFPDGFDVEQFVAPLEHYDRLKVLAPRVVNRLSEPLYDPQPRLIEAFVFWDLLPKVPDVNSNAEVTPAYVVPGSCLLVAADLFETQGGFDERFFLYREEVEFCMRTLQSGYWVGIHERERVVHDEPDSLRHSSDYQMYYNIRNWFLLVATRFGGWQRLPAYGIVAMSVASQVMRASAAGRPGLLYPLTLGVFDGLAGRFGRRRYLNEES